MTDLTTAPTRRGPVPIETGIEQQLEAHRTGLTGYCYRMLGSAFEAEDAVQETMVRAWKSFDRFEGRSSVKTWLHRIATNVCLDMLDGRQRRARPMDFGPVGSPEAVLAPPLAESTWVQPIPDARVQSTGADPADTAVARESIRLAFVAALQLLPARQRAVLISREVLRLPADETAELLDTSVASVNSALQRARATMAASELTDSDVFDAGDEDQQALLARYVDAFERYDIDALTSLLHEEVTLSMPPYDLWLRGREDLIAWFVGPGAECEGSRLVPTVANGMPAFGQYRVDPAGGHAPWSLQVLEFADGELVHFNAFLDTPALFPLFDLPAHLD